MNTEKIRGVYIRVEEWDRVFNILISPLPITSFIWFVKDLDALDNVEDLNGQVSGHELVKYLDQLNNIIFGKFVAFPIDYEGELDIATYEEFLLSEARMILLVVDGYHFEFYFKDNDLTRRVAENVENNGYKVEIITEENDGRTRMNVW